MKFDRTKGKKARYLVSVYGWNVEDRYYYHYYREAKALFNEIKGKRTTSGNGNVVSVYDIEKDVRKDFARL